VTRLIEVDGMVWIEIEDVKEGEGECVGYGYTYTIPNTSAWERGGDDVRASELFPP
jgi:hypothetical protein